MKIDLKKLHWRCRRGMLELDMLLNDFLQNKFNKLSAELQTKFINLLDYTDPELYQWLIGSVEPPVELAEIIYATRKSSS